MKIIKTVVLLAALPALASWPTGCASDDAGPVTSPTRAASQPPASVTQVPECSQVWQTGQTLPANYAGCSNGGTVEAAVEHACKSGPGLVAYGNSWAQLGGPIQTAQGELAADPAYKAAFDGC